MHRGTLERQREQPTIHISKEGPEILKTEVGAAMAKMNRNKSAGPVRTVIEMLTTVDNFGIDKIRHHKQKLYTGKPR